MDTLPLLTALAFGAIGSGLCLYGKKQQRVPHWVAGLVLIGFPYLVSSAAWMAVIGVLVLGALVFAVRRGM